ncbi:MAG: hypothetical protein PX636_01030 [Microcystis sp. M53598_WE2]|nr:hypothetical protein [Microcystis sp. M53598_WE2]
MRESIGTYPLKSPINSLSVKPYTPHPTPHTPHPVPTKNFLPQTLLTG